MALRRTLRGLARLGGIGLLALIGLPVALLAPAALLDRGPGGAARGSLFPIVLTALDPFVWACARNSLVVAGVVTAGSLGLGLAMAMALGTRRYWGRPVLAALAWLPMAAPPAFSALGLSHLAGPSAIGPGLAEATGRALFLGVGWDDWASWGLLVWAGLATSTPVVALSVIAALGRVDPAWADAGRALGASRRRAWRQLAWPTVRPEVARALAAVFATALLEPGGPIVLGLTRTLPYQVVQSVLRGDPTTRPAALALLGLGLALGGRALIRWRGGPRAPIAPDDRDDRPSRASWLGAGLAIVGLSAWLALGLAPLWGLVGIALRPADPAEGRGWVVSLASVVYGLLDPDTGRLWANALRLGLAATLLDAGLVALLSRRPGPSRPARPPRPSLLILGLERTPPLVFGVAMALVPAVLAMAADRLGLAPLHRLGAGLDPIRWPGLLLIVAVAAARLPTLARAADRAEARSRPALADAALSLGGSSRQAARMAGGRGPGLGVVVLTFALATTGVAPALVLAPTARTRPVGPAVVILAHDPPRAAGLALGAVALNLIGLASARRTRSGPPGDWFRG